MNAAFAAVALSVIVAAGAAGGQVQGPVVALSVDEDDSPLAQRLRAELGSLGVNFTELKDTGLALDRVARDAGAIAAIRVLQSSAGVEIWIADRVTGKTVSRRITGPPQEATALRVPDIALRAVELLRASLLEVASPHPSRGEVAAPPEIRRIAEQEVQRSDHASHVGFFDVGAGVIGSAGGVPPAIQVVLGADLRVFSAARIQILAGLPLSATRVSAPEGSATVGTTLFAAGIGFDITPRPGRLQANIGTGAAALWLQVHGIGQPPYIGGTANAVTFAPTLRCSVSIHFESGLGVYVQALTGYALAEPVMRFLGRDVAAFGRPFAQGVLGVRVGWL